MHGEVMRGGEEEAAGEQAPADGFHLYQPQSDWEGLACSASLWVEVGWRSSVDPPQCHATSPRHPFNACMSLGCLSHFEQHVNKQEDLEDLVRTSAEQKVAAAD
eukprot:3064548-Amphidinium_carterae.1